MYRNFREMEQAVASQKKKRVISVAVAEDAHVLESVREAYDRGLIEAVLVGCKEAILAVGAAHGIDLTPFRIVDAADKEDACAKAVSLVADGQAQILMKGLVDTSVIIHEVLKKEYGLRGSGSMSHVGVYDLPRMDRLLIVSDSSLNIAPNLETKAHILENAVFLAHALGNPEPKVAVICAVEKVNPKMQATLDAAALKEMAEAGRFPRCVVSGPLALDNAVSPESARIKGINDPVAGCADILLVPNIECGNVLVKSMNYFGGAELGAVIVGAKVPIVLTSRAASAQSKLNAIILSGILAAELHQ